MIKPGKTMVGSVDSDQQVDIRLTGDNVLPQHCYFETLPDGSVQLVALADSTTMVNGQRIGSDKVHPSLPLGDCLRRRSAQPRALRSGYRIIIGWHAFRFKCVTRTMPWSC